MQKICLLLTILLIVGLVSQPIAARAEGPWKWQLSLVIKKEKQGNKMKLPTGLYVDKERERYYVVDADDNSLHSFDIKGGYLNSLKPGDQLKVPLTMVRDDQEVLWVVEKGRNALTKIDLKAKEIIPNQLTYKGHEVYPDHLEFVDGNFYVLDKFTGSIIVFSHDLKPLGDFSCDKCPNGFIDFTIKDGVTWALDNEGKRLYRFPGMGKKPDRQISLDGQVLFPFSVAVGPTGQLYVLDRHAGDIVVYGDNGEFKYRFLTKGQTRGRVYYPEDIQFDYWGRLCVVDSGNGRVEIFGR